MLSVYENREKNAKNHENVSRGVKLGQKNLKDRKQFVLLTGYRTGEPRCATFFHAVLVASCSILKHLGGACNFTSL